MRSIAVREFQLHASKYLKELPLVLTVHNKPVAQVVSINHELTNTPQVVSKIINITESDIQDISNDYKVNTSFVRYQLEALKNYCESSGRKYKNYKAALRNFVIRDIKNQIEKKVDNQKGKVIDATNI